MSNNLALTPVTPVAHQHNGENGARHLIEQVSQGSSWTANTAAGPAPLTDATVAAILKGRGIRGWLRLCRVARVLGLFTLYLFLDTYDIRATFNQRMAARRSGEQADWKARLQAYWHQSPSRQFRQTSQAGALGSLSRPRGFH